MQISLLLQLQVERNVNPPKCDVSSLGRPVHAAIDALVRFDLFVWLKARRPIDDVVSL